jgi:hypothetical protein
MNMIHATFRLQILKERERYKFYLLSQRHFLHQSKLRKLSLGRVTILKWKLFETIGMSKQWKE